MIKSKEELIKQVKANSAIPEQAKKLMLAHIEQAEFGQDLLFWVEDRLQDIINEAFDQIGVTVDPNDPAYKAAEAKMMKEMDAADKEFAGTMNQLQKDAQKVISSASAKIDTDQLQALRSQMRAGS